MSFTYDLETDVGKLRLEIGDNNLSNITGDDRTKWSCVFTDEEIEYFISKEDTLNLAAAAALDAIANDKAKLAIRETLGDYTGDLTSLAEKLQKRAESLRKQEEEKPACDVAVVPCDDFSYRESLL